MKNEVGLKHIALELGLSIVAVSRALKDWDDISESTKHKVRLKAIFRAKRYETPIEKFRVYSGSPHGRCKSLVGGKRYEERDVW